MAVKNMYLGGTSIDGMYLGTQEVQAMYIGDQEVFTAGDIVTLKYMATEQVVPHVAYSDPAWTATYSADTYNTATTKGEVVFSGVTATIPASAYTESTGLTEFTVSKGVTSVGDYAFDGCTSLTGVTVKNTVTDMGNYTFFNCTGLTQVSLPNSITALTGTFQYCRSLPTVELPSGITSIGDNLFFGCTSLTGITIPTGVTAIGDNAFLDCTGLTRIEIPSGVTTIGDQAFYHSGIQELTFKGSTPPATVGTDAWKYIPDNGTIFCAPTDVTAYTAWLANQTGPILTWTVSAFGLPSEPFMFNYNAKTYNASTMTFPKDTSSSYGPLFNEDLVLNDFTYTGKQPTAHTDYVSFVDNDIHIGMIKSYSTGADNPFNRTTHTSGDTPLTIIYKTGHFDSNMTNLFANRDNSFFNYMVRGSAFHDGLGLKLEFSATTDPCIMMIRVNPSTQVLERTQLAVDGSVIQTQTLTYPDWYYGPYAMGVAFFAGGSEYLAEFFNGDFYWMYLSNSYLSDSEIEQVISYNENM